MFLQLSFADKVIPQFNNFICRRQHVSCPSFTTTALLITTISSRGNLKKTAGVNEPCKWEQQQKIKMSRKQVRLRARLLCIDTSGNEQPMRQGRATPGKFKTELCKNYMEKGQCKYGPRCQFAHGTRQLQLKPAGALLCYRKKKCTSFWQQGFCPYGSRCQFSHQEGRWESRPVLLGLSSILDISLSTCPKLQTLLANQP